MDKNHVTREVIIQRRAKRTLRQLPKEVLNSIAATIDDLAQNPSLASDIRFKDHDHLYRMYVEGWRIIYALENEKLIILILETSPRPRWGKARK